MYNLLNMKQIISKHFLQFKKVFSLNSKHSLFTVEVLHLFITMAKFCFENITGAHFSKFCIICKNGIAYKNTECTTMMFPQFCFLNTWSTIYKAHGFTRVSAIV